MTQLPISIPVSSFTTTIIGNARPTITRNTKNARRRDEERRSEKGFREGEHRVTLNRRPITSSFTISTSYRVTLRRDCDAPRFGFRFVAMFSSRGDRVPATGLIRKLPTRRSFFRSEETVGRCSTPTSNIVESFSRRIRESTRQRRGSMLVSR